MKKKIAVIFMSLVLCAGFAAGCGTSPDPAPSSQSEETGSVVSDEMRQDPVSSEDGESSAGSDEAQEVPVLSETDL